AAAIARSLLLVDLPGAAGDCVLLQAIAPQISRIAPIETSRFNAYLVILRNNMSPHSVDVDGPPFQQHLVGQWANLGCLVISSRASCRPTVTRSTGGYACLASQVFWPCESTRPTPAGRCE